MVEKAAREGKGLFHDGGRGELLIDIWKGRVRY